MTDQHRATPEQWTHVAICAEMKQQVPWATAACLLELRARIEALEAAQLEQAESHRFCTDAIVRRVEALEAFDHRPLLAAVRAQSKAVAHFGNRLDALDAASAEVRPTVKAPITRDRDETGDYLIIHDAPPPTGSLLREVALTITPASQTLNYELARAAIREVAAWLREGGDYSADAWADMLEREADRG
jgi:hypothetical protein